MRRLFVWAVLCWLIVVAILPDPARAVPRHHGPITAELAIARAWLPRLLLRPAHGDFGWIMRDKATAWCCDPSDCFEVDDVQVRQLGGVWHVNGRPVDPRNVYPSKHKNMAFVACFRPDGAPRCLFLPLQG